MTSTRTRYSTVAIVLHWLIAAAIVFQIVLGWRMGGGTDASTYAVFQLHKSIGITILVLSLARLGWRIATPPPPAPPGQPRWEKAASHLTHLAFYGIMIGLPVTGWLLVSASRINIPTVLFGVIPWPHLPGISGLAPDAKAAWETFAQAGHSALAYLTYGLLALHIGAVIKHQWRDRDAVLGRMVGGARPGLGEPRLWLVAAGLAACGLAGFLYAAPPRATAPAPAAVAIEAPPVPADDTPTPDDAEPSAGDQAEMSAEDAPPEVAAQPQPQPQPQPLARWAVRRSDAQLRFSTLWSGAPVEGRFRQWDADILFSPDDLGASRIRVSIDTGSADTGDAQRDSSLPGVEFFDTSSHPTAVFESARIRRTGQGRYVAEGSLTLRGVRSPVSLPFRLDIDGDLARASGGVGLDRTVFGVGQGMYASTDAIPALVQVNFSFTAARGPVD